MSGGKSVRDWCREKAREGSTDRRLTEKVSERGKRGGDPSLREAQQRAGIDIAAGGGGGMSG